MVEQDFQPVFLIDPYNRFQFENEIDQLDDDTLWTTLSIELPTLVFHIYPIFGTD